MYGDMSGVTGDMTGVIGKMVLILAIRLNPIKVIRISYVDSE